LLARETNLTCCEIAAAGVLLHSASADFAAQSRSAFSISQLPDAVRNYLDNITLF
jgi:NAD(P)H-hydrate repair Nnr-like enzyme with NAD(P)H-hydrate dehydratase domain